MSLADDDERSSALAFEVDGTFLGRGTNVRGDFAG
ncbi:hypothetical protein ZOD2009_04472 [Haladaptatus paucihalophilus DX253]|uniref:Uncharacterized protein n=1 Tax=Haladaptatus paucihalophilus DX253 TaxID=797209 RepID=E7QQ24_HALPU|nr:hypothetical protein ZOD2009_04472 [Haladaptatus paucihalophilus DX253]